MNKNSWSLKLTVLLVSSLTIMSIVTISPALPEIGKAFAGVNNSDFLVKMTLTIPALFIAISSTFAGMLIDKYGRLKLLFIALVLYAFAGSSGFWLQDIYHLLISRAILGMAVGVSMTVITTLVADYFDGMDRQKFVGIQIAFMSLGGILFIGLGGFLTDYSWRFPFLIYLFSLAVLPFAIKYLYEPDRIKTPIGGHANVTSPSIIYLLFFNVMTMWIFFFLIPVQLPFYMKNIGIESNALIGIAIALSTAFSAISSFSYSALKNRFSFYTIFAAGYVLMAISFGIISISESFGMIALAMIIAGFGMGMMIPNTNMWVMKISPPEIRGMEIGRLTGFWFFGQFLSPIILLPLASSYSISNSFLICGIILFGIAIAFVLLKMLSPKEA